jgi:hypothetical protein
MVSLNLSTSLYAPPGVSYVPDADSGTRLSAERAEGEGGAEAEPRIEETPPEDDQDCPGSFCTTQSTPTPTVFSSSGALAKAIDGKGWVLSLSLSLCLSYYIR